LGKKVNPFHSNMDLIYFNSNPDKCNKKPEIKLKKFGYGSFRRQHEEVQRYRTTVV